MDTKITVYYYAKAGINLGKLNCVVGQEDHVLTPEELEQDSYKKELYKDTLLWEGAEPLMAGYPLEDENKPGYIRLATRVELVNMGLDKLNPGEIIKNGVIVTIEKPNDFAEWKINQWVTDFDHIPDGYKVEDIDKQLLSYIAQPNSYAKWDKMSQSWKTNVEDLGDGEKLNPDQSIEIIERPVDDKAHKWAWTKVTFTWENIISPEELKANYHEIVSRLKTQCVDEGFVYKGYQQKCRVLDITWLQCREKETFEEAFKTNQIDDKYNLLVPREQLKKVAWVFDHNEVLLLDFVDFHEMFGFGASFTQAAYVAEETLKSMEDFNIDITIDDFRITTQKYTKVPVYGVPQSQALSLRRRRKRDLTEHELQPGHYTNPGHQLGLTGADVMLANFYGVSLEEYKEEKDKSNQ